MGELAFSFLGVRTDGCRRRFICELDFRARTNPVTRLAFSFISRGFFERYRNVGVKPHRFLDCARMFNDCKDAEKYNNDDDEEYDDNETNNDFKGETTTVLDGDIDATVTEADVSNEDSANEVRQMRQFNDDVAHYLHLDRSSVQQ